MPSFLEVAVFVQGVALIIMAVKLGRLSNGFDSVKTEFVEWSTKQATIYNEMQRFYRERKETTKKEL